MQILEIYIYTIHIHSYTYMYNFFHHHHPPPPTPPTPQGGGGYWYIHIHTYTTSSTTTTTHHHPPPPTTTHHHHHHHHPHHPQHRGEGGTPPPTTTHHHPPPPTTTHHHPHHPHHRGGGGYWGATIQTHNHGVGGGGGTWCKYSRKSKDLTLPFGSRESFTWILRKAILCLVLDFQVIHMGVSKNRGTPKSSIFNRVFHYKPSILGIPLLFSKAPISFFSPTSGESRRPWRKKIAWLRLGAWKKRWERTWRIIPGFCGSDHSHVYASLHIGHVWPCKEGVPQPRGGRK